jgi:RNA polymerase sigma-70 factor, ECF subfamily
MSTIAMANTDKRIDIFNLHRARLFGVAYRMLGIRADAEDVVQETYIRWHKADISEIEIPEAWLVTVTTRLAIDRLRKLSSQRETYIGPWLPEPLIVDPAMSQETRAETASDVSIAFMVMLERLSPIERAVFLLHDVFDIAHAEIAKIVAKSETAVRQMVSRARTRVRTDRTRFEADEASRSKLIRKFITASYAGDEQTLMSIFAEDAAMMSDGGGNVNAARRLVSGNKRPKAGDRMTIFEADINGEPGIIEFLDGEPFSATTFTIEAGQISSIYRVMNPDKLVALVNLDRKLFRDELSHMGDSDRLL